MTRDEFKNKYRDTVIAFTIWQIFTVGWFNIRQLLNEMNPEQNMPGVTDCLADYMTLSLNDQRWFMKRYL